MRDIYAEKVVEAALDDEYSHWGCEHASRDDCPVMRRLYGRLERLKCANNARIIEVLDDMPERGPRPMR